VGAPDSDSTILFDHRLPELVVDDVGAVLVADNHRIDVRLLFRMTLNNTL
jgi:hypothetical protein